MVCNRDFYNQWYNSSFLHPIRNDIISTLLSIDRSSFKLWSAMDFERTRVQFASGKLQIRNGDAMNVLALLCRENLESLAAKNSGNHGPISDQDIHDGLCNPFCIINDVLRKDAMKFSGCNCIELSVSYDNISLTRKDNWCYQQSAHMLCDQLDVCGSWVCNLADFECKRNEYNRKFVPLKGYGNNCSSCDRRKNLLAVLIIILVLMVAFYM